MAHFRAALATAEQKSLDATMLESALNEISAHLCTEKFRPLATSELCDLANQTLSFIIKDEQEHVAKLLHDAADGLLQVVLGDTTGKIKQECKRSLQKEICSNSPFGQVVIKVAMEAIVGTDSEMDDECWQLLARASFVAFEGETFVAWFREILSDRLSCRTTLEQLLDGRSTSITMNMISVASVFGIVQETVDTLVGPFLSPENLVNCRHSHMSIAALTQLLTYISETSPKGVCDELRGKLSLLENTIKERIEQFNQVLRSCAVPTIELLNELRDRLIAFKSFSDDARIYLISAMLSEDLRILLIVTDIINELPLINPNIRMLLQLDDDRIHDLAMSRIKAAVNWKMTEDDGPVEAVFAAPIQWFASLPHERQEDTLDSLLSFIESLEPSQIHLYYPLLLFFKLVERHEGQGQTFVGFAFRVISYLQFLNPFSKFGLASSQLFAKTVGQMNAVQFNRFMIGLCRKRPFLRKNDYLPFLAMIDIILDEPAENVKMSQKTREMLDNMLGNYWELNGRFSSVKAMVCRLRNKIAAKPDLKRKTPSGGVEEQDAKLRSH